MGIGIYLDKQSTLFFTLHFQVILLLVCMYGLTEANGIQPSNTSYRSYQFFGQ